MPCESLLMDLDVPEMPENARPPGGILYELGLPTGRRRGLRCNTLGWWHDD